MRRNPVELGHDALRGPGEVRRVRYDERGSTPAEKLLQFLITPPLFRDVMIRQQTSFACFRLSGAKQVHLQLPSLIVLVQGSRPLVIHPRLAGGIRSDM